MKPFTIVTEIKPFKTIHEERIVEVSYEMLQHGTPNANGLVKLVGWHPYKDRFDTPLYLKPMSVVEYTLAGNGD